MDVDISSIDTIASAYQLASDFLFPGIENAIQFARRHSTDFITYSTLALMIGGAPYTLRSLTRETNQMLKYHTKNDDETANL